MKKFCFITLFFMITHNNTTHSASGRGGIKLELMQSLVELTLQSLESAHDNNLLRNALNKIYEILLLLDYKEEEKNQLADRINYLLKTITHKKNNSADLWSETARLLAKDE